FSVLHLLAIFLIIALPSLIVRIRYPIDHWVGLFGFFQVEPAHWPQYLVMFSVGIIAYRKNWLNTLKTKTGYTCIAIALLMAAVVYIIPQGSILGLWYVWAVYGSLLAVTMSFGLLTLFREKGNRTTPLLKALSRCSYAAYIIHFPIVLAVQYALDTVVIGGAVGKFVTVSIVSVLLTYVLSALLVKVKPLGKIL
ncbi:MAG: acyltransferase family protein, partial [Oscillospiraceae bacterium]|nr:acyltransferase family protein [Oscillospiraceae bacterium]